jgi:hypothetical protein
MKNQAINQVEHLVDSMMAGSEQQGTLSQEKTITEVKTKIKASISDIQEQKRLKELDYSNYNCQAEARSIFHLSRLAQ